MTFSFADFTSLTGVSLAGNAQQLTNLVRLTEAAGAQAGALWADKTIDPRGDFQTSYTANLHDGSRADGIALVLTNPNQPLVGTGGGGLGYAGLTPSLAVEFDIYSNGEPSNNEVEITRSGTSLASKNPGFQLWNAGPIHAWVDYTGATHTLNVYVSNTATKPDQPLHSVQVDLGALLGASARVGFTGSTGGSTAQQDLTSWALTDETLPGHS